VVAQLAEQRTVNASVVGSTPTHGATLIRVLEACVKFEASVKISVPRFSIRVWRLLDEGESFNRAEHADLEALAHKNQELDMSELAVLLASASKVTAVEILDWNRCGIRVGK
jgi:hypothetical protein